MTRKKKPDKAPHTPFQCSVGHDGDLLGNQWRCKTCRGYRPKKPQNSYPSAMASLVDRFNYVSCFGWDFGIKVWVEDRETIIDFSKKLDEEGKSITGFNETMAHIDYKNREYLKFLKALEFARQLDL